MIYALSAYAGLALGSFANVCIYRLPKDESLWFPRSHCPFCNKKISWKDNIPLISFLWLRGACRFCKKPISWRYPLVELAMLTLFIFSAYFFHNDIPHMIVFDLMSFYLLTISIIDFDHKIIPDELSLSLLALGWAGSFLNPYLVGSPASRFIESVFAALAGGGLMLTFAWAGEKMFKKEALGGGDIKLMAAFGATLGWQGVANSLIIGSFTGALCGVALLLLKRKKPGDAIPYGPFLCLGAFIRCLFPGWSLPF